MTADLEQALRQEGTRYHDMADRTRGDLTDVNRRTGRQRNRRRAAAGSTVAAGVVVLVVAVGLARAPEPSSVRQWGTTPESIPVSTEAPATSAPPPTAGTSIAPRGSTPAAPGTTPPSSPTTTVTTSAPNRDITAVDFRNATLPPDSCPLGGVSSPPAAGIPLSNGRWNAPTGEYVMVEDVGYGDVSGDGRAEAVVRLSCSAGGNAAKFSPVWVFTQDPAAPTGTRRLAYPELTAATLAEVGLPGARVTGAYAASVWRQGELTVNWIVEPADNPRALKIVTTTQRWAGSSWATVSPPIVKNAGGP